MSQFTMSCSDRLLTLDSTDVLDLTVQTLTTQFDLSVKGHNYTAETIFHILTAASVKGKTIEDMCGQLQEGPHPNAVRYQLKKELLKRIGELEDAANEALLAHLPPHLCSKAHKVAIDLVFIPYHGQAQSNDNELRRSQAKSGTTTFHCYATAYIIKRNKRCTLALTYVRATDTLIDVLERLLARLAAIGISCKHLYLDRQFFTVRVIRYLQERCISAIIPVVLRGRSGGLRELLKGRKSYKRAYTMKSPRNGSVSFEVWVVCKYSHGKYKRHGVKRFAYAVLGDITCPLPQVYEEYRQRFGIESSYRLMNQVRARTASRDPGLRLLFVSIAFILLNLWVYLKWMLGCPRQGGRYIQPHFFILSRLRLFLEEAVKEIYGVTLSIQTASPS
jgi:hypothetical protein